MSGILLASVIPGAGIVIEVQAPTYFDATSTPADARVRVRFASNGTVDVLRLAGPDSNNIYNWITPLAAAPDDYEIRCTLDSGGPLTGGSDATGVWLALSSTREWGVEELGFGVTDADITIAIRKGSGAIIDQASGTITADST